MGTGAAGAILKEKLHDFHLADVRHVVAQVASEHIKTCDCHYSGKNPCQVADEVIAEVLPQLRCLLGEALEKREVRSEAKAA